MRLTSYFFYEDNLEGDFLFWRECLNLSYVNKGSLFIMIYIYVLGFVEF